MRKILALLFILLCAGSIRAQQKFTLSGYVRDSLSNEVIIGATVNAGNRTVTTNQYGFYSLTVDTANVTVISSHVAFLPVGISVTLNRDTTLNIFLMAKSAGLQEVVVYSRRRDGNVKNAQMGKIDLTMSQVKSVPAFLGEVDLLKTIQLLPGVRNAGEGNAGFYVRGGGPDQNLILLDDAVVYNTGHLFGFFSVFNSDAIKNVSLIKGGMPSQYGGRLSSVLDISMKDGNAKEFHADGGIGLIASRISLEGPIKKEKASFMISGRRTYIDALTKPFISKESEFYGSGYYFYDFNAKANYRFSDKDRLYLSGYFGRDVFTFRNSERGFNADIPWGNSTATLRWNHVYSSKLFSNTTLVYNDYKFSFGAAQENFKIKLSSGIKDGTIKTDFDWYPGGNHRFKYGGQLTYHQFIPNVTSGEQDSVVFNPPTDGKKYAIESALYAQDEWDVTPALQIAYGLRLSAFTQLGPYTGYVRDQNLNKLDSVYYGNLKPVKTYTGLEPRFTFRYTLNPSTSIKGSVTRNLQFIHLVSNSGTTLPTDIWVPSTARVKPQLGWQYAAGLFKNFKDNQWETSVEVYYKDMRNQIEYREGYRPSFRDVEEEFVFGRGWSYGSEWFVNKVRGRFTGWVGYTLSWTWRRFKDLNDGERYPAKYDRRHDLSVVGMYELNKKWKFGAVFVYGTGNATTLPERFYFVNGALTQEYSKINQYRLAPYHRLDLSATLTPKKNENRKLKSSWVFSVYNVYSRMNPYFVYFDETGSVLSGNLQVEGRQVSLFPILPSVTWNFHF